MTSDHLTQNPDIQFLGRVLGDVIREQGGERLYALTERIRSASVARARGEAGEDGLGDLTLGETLDFVRGFMLFSLLANIAEDREGVAREEGADLAAAIAALEGQGVGRGDVTDLLRSANMVPVFTAHPTEVRRRSILDHRACIAQLMALRDTGRDTGAKVTPEGDRVEAAIKRQVILLWQTRPLRREKLVVADEVDNALAVVRDVLMPVLPGLYARWETALGERPPAFLRIGSWIGGDRDGNPFVTADTLTMALSRGGGGGAGPHARRAARAGPRAVDLRRAGRRARRGAGAGRGERRRCARAGRRALSPRDLRPLRAHGGDLRGAGRPSAAAPLSLGRRVLRLA